MSRHEVSSTVIDTGGWFDGLLVYYGSADIDKNRRIKKNGHVAETFVVKYEVLASGPLLHDTRLTHPYILHNTVLACTAYVHNTIVALLYRVLSHPEACHRYWSGFSAGGKQ